MHPLLTQLSGLETCFVMPMRRQGSALGGAELICLATWENQVYMLNHRRCCPISYSGQVAPGFDLVRWAWLRLDCGLLDDGLLAHGVSNRSFGSVYLRGPCLLKKI